MPPYPIKYREGFSGRLNNLGKIMYNNNISQTQLEELSNVSRTYICQLIQGKHCPSIHIAIKISRALNVNIEAIWGVCVEDD
jgi:DNA-binding XRE family transcriptional regulator